MISGIIPNLNRGPAMTSQTKITTNNASFKDHFSHDSAAYSMHRPGYPDSLFSFLSSITKKHDLAWDCATGSGQSAIRLAESFNTVLATDASEAQINNARKHKKVHYYVAAAENAAIKNSCVDLITVAQAMHWFRIDAFGREVARVLRRDGVLVAWTYGFFHISPGIDALIEREFFEPVEAYWPDGAEVAWSGYRDVELPLLPVEAPELPMVCDWSLLELAAYLGSWSALRYYSERHGGVLLERALEQVEPLWGDPARRRAVNMDFAVRAWRNAASVI